MPAPRRRLQPLFCALALCLLGLWCAGKGLAGLAKTAIFVHEAAVVEGMVADVRQRPFDAWEDTLGKGNVSWPGDVSYQPIVNFTMPTGLAVWGAELDADNVDYHKGQAVGVIVPRDAPGKARLYRWKLLWGGDCLRLLAGALLLLPGWLILKRKPRSAATPAPRQEQPRREAPRREAPHKPAPRRAPATQQGELPLDLDAPRRRRQPAPANGTPAAPRKPRSRKKAADGTTPAPKRRKPRAKAADKG